MHSINLIAKALRANCDKDEDFRGWTGETTIGVCAITGIEGPCLPRKDLLGPSFVSIGLLACPSNNFVSVDAYETMKYKWERMSSFFCDGERFVRLDRQGVRNMVLSEDMPASWIGYATTSYKKHGCLATKVNTGNKRYWTFEQRLVNLTDFEKTKMWWEMLNIYIRRGISRPVMESLVCPPYVIKIIGLSTWIEFEKWARSKHLSALYSFLCYLLPSQAELKEEKK